MVPISNSPTATGTPQRLGTRKSGPASPATINAPSSSMLTQDRLVLEIQRQKLGGIPVSDAQNLQELSKDFWSWRAAEQPRSGDDIPRVERPDGWIPQWSAADVARYRTELAEFEGRLAQFYTFGEIEPNTATAEWIDKSLLHSALSRVRWELDYLEIWRRQPRFYIDQTIGVVFDYLTPQAIDTQSIANVRRALQSFKKTLSDARENLTSSAYRELAQESIAELSDIQTQLLAVGENLLPFITSEDIDLFLQEFAIAGNELNEFRDWLVAELPHFPLFKSIGESGFNWFLRNVAFNPLTTTELINIGNIEFDRAIFLEAVHKNRYSQVALPELPETAEIQSTDEARLEREVRAFYEAENLLTQPATLREYLNAPRPAYLEPIRWLGVTDDLTGPSRLDVDGISYVPVPHKEMPYFYAANARDPRAGIVHEGAHYKQLAMAWRHEREIRRHYYDSGVNEGIAFYNEEMMLAAGLFADKPHSQTLMYNFMRLRALRVIIDVSLATGQMDIETAAQFLAQKVPMDVETAREEAVFFAGFPGQGLTYQIGKTQIVKLLADAIRSQGEEFSLRKFHDYLWMNGNVPISLLRYELLNDTSELNVVLGINDRRDADEIWGNVRKMLDAFMAKDRVLADSYISDDVTLWDSEERDMVFTLVGLNQLRDRRPTDGSGPKLLGIDNIKPVISVHGDLAIARYELHVRTEGGTHDEYIRNTAIWRRENGKWKCFHNHEDKLAI